MMTREGFRQWMRRTALHWARFGWGAKADRDWANKIRPHDPVLAGLYDEMATVRDKMRAHVGARLEEDRAKGPECA